MQTFRDLKVWQKAHELVLKIYKISKTFPKEEIHGITAQLRRSATSIPANIVEGFKRKSKKDFAHFLNIADASLEETKYYLLLSYDLAYIDENNFSKLSCNCDEIGRMLNGLQKKY